MSHKPLARAVQAKLSFHAMRPPRCNHANTRDDTRRAEHIDGHKFILLISGKLKMTHRLRFEIVPRQANDPTPYGPSFLPVRHEDRNGARPPTSSAA